MRPDERIAKIAAKQHGAFTTSQAIAAGFSEMQIRHRYRTGRWLRIYRSVFVLAGTPDTIERRLTTAVLAYSPLAAISHLSAAHLWGIVDGLPDRTHLVMPHGRRRPARAGLAVHQADLDRRDVRKQRGIFVTAPERTVVDLATQVPKSRLEIALDESVFRGLLTVKSLTRYLGEHDFSRKRGMGNLTRLLLDRGVGVPQKELERIFDRKLKASRLPQPTRQHPHGNRFIDISYPDKRIAIELDGQAIHSTGRAFRDDRRRQNRLVLDGWLILRFTWFDVTQDWPFVEETLREALAGN